jgi:hypothetical protein
MKTKTRRECIASGGALLLTGFALTKSAVGLAGDHALQNTLIKEFRRAVCSLRPPAPDLMPTVAQISEVKRIGNLVIKSGVTKIKSNNASDGACNHWLASIQAHSRHA